jgi:sulfate adenylyltransferase large subunit
MGALPKESGFEDLQTAQQCKTLLRFIVCGSVDHGKSTLIGRLLFEAGVVFEDQLEALDRDSCHHGTQGEEPDFALLLDGLAAEREQNITIDVAYRFFATTRRKFIVADTPGHEQYTRNMATGASTADVALLLVSASEGITRQTRRHALIVSMLGVRHVVVAVNKMDLVSWSQSGFRALESEFRAFTDSLGVDRTVFIPVAARSGDNIIRRSECMNWYRGPTLLEHLERVEVGWRPQRSAFRMPIQWVNRPNAEFRGYCGSIASGELYPGALVQVLPSGRRTQVKRIVTADGDLARAVAGQSVTLTFSDDIDASRGEVVADLAEPASVTDRFSARLVWFDEQPLELGRPYILKLAAATANAAVEPPPQVIDLGTLRSTRTDRLGSNDIGTAIVQLDRLVAADRYADSPSTGSFILIDPESYNTAAIGMIEATHVTENLSWHGRQSTLEDFIRATETHSRSIAKAISWRATGSIDTFLVAVVITGSSKVAGGVALAEVLTKTLLCYLHERIWALIPWGKHWS